LNKISIVNSTNKMSFLDRKLENIFQMILKSSEPRTDGCHFSRFTSISDLWKSIHTELSSSSSDYHEIDRIHSVILLIWDDWLMRYSNVPSTYHERYEYHQRPSDRSEFERIIRSIIRTFLFRIHEIVPRLYDFQRDTYRENCEHIKSVLDIGIQLPLEEMFDVTQTRPDFPISISVYHDEVDRFINVYLWVILILLKEGYQYDDISDPCNQAVAVFLEERRKRDEAVIQMKSNEKECLTQFFEKRGVDMSKVHLRHDSDIRAFSTCGNLYTTGWKGTHKCGSTGALHHATKHVGMASLCILRPTKCCLNCEGVFNAYRDCGHIVCDAHLDKDQPCCPECSTRTWVFKLNLPEQKIGE
jgi:hypothetical protein